MREKERLRNSSRLQEIILGNQWSKLTWVVWQQEVPIRKKVLPPKTNQENSGGAQRRVEKPTHMSYEPPEILAGIHHGWEIARTTRKYAESDQIWAQARRLPRDNPETMHDHKTWDCDPQNRAVILGSCTTLLLSVQAPLTNKVFFFFSFTLSVLCLLEQFIFECSTSTYCSDLEKVPLPATIRRRQDIWVQRALWD